MTVILYQHLHHLFVLADPAAVLIVLLSKCGLWILLLFVLKVSIISYSDCSVAAASKIHRQMKGPPALGLLPMPKVKHKKVLDNDSDRDWMPRNVQSEKGELC